MAEHPVLPGAEPFSAPGGPHGALVLDREEAGHWFEIATNKSAQLGELGLRSKFDDFWLGLVRPVKQQYAFHTGAP